MVYAAIALVVLMVAAFIFMPKPTMKNASAAGFDEFSYPTNSNARVVPEVFGTVLVHGNIIFAGDLTSEAIEK